MLYNESMDLIQKHCVPCEGGTPSLGAKEIEEYKKSVPGWEVSDGKKIRREFKFKDFRGSINFVRKVADLAEAEGHHPDIYIFYNVVRLELSTHAVRGLSENDFILAAKVNSVNE